MLQGTQGIWKRLPFARIIIYFLTGIIIDTHVNLSGTTYGLITFSTLLSICVVEYFPLQYRWKIKTLHGALIGLSILLLGGISNHLSSQQSTTIQAESGIDSSHLLLKIKSKSRSGDSTIRYTATLFKPHLDSYIKHSNSFLYINKKFSNNLKKGDLLITVEKPKRIKHTSNPGAFDFSAYGHQQQVDYTLHAQNDTYYITLRKSGDDNNTMIEQIREKILFILRNTIKNKTHIGLAEAMLIGYREDLEKTLLNTYVATGVVHVIAISGLHLGLIFMLIDLGIKNIFGKKRAVIAGIVVTIPVLWIFAILTGSSSSVNRSALMFTVLIFGRVISKRNNSLNALCASAFILLLCDTNTINDIGFQLSYAAVGSILLFEKHIQQLIFLKNKIAIYVWNMISISLAAQILTTPLVILHFHRFPLLFLFSNLVAVPLSSIILILEIVLCIFFMINIDVRLIAKLIEELMSWMNGYIKAISSIPFNSINDIYVSKLQMTGWCLLAGSVAWLLVSASKKKYWVTSILLLVLGFIRCMEHAILLNEKRLIILNIKETSAIVVQDGEQGLLVIGKSKSADTAAIQRLLKETGNGTGIKLWQTRYLPDKPFMMNVSTDKMPHTSNKRIEKAVLISGNPGLTLSEMGIGSDSSEQVIIDGSSKLWKIRQWEKEAYGLHLPLHSTAENGPYTIQIK